MTRPAVAILGLVLLGSLVSLEGTAEASHPGTTFLTAAPQLEQVTVAPDGTVIGLVPVVFTVKHTDASYGCTKVSMVHLIVDGAQAEFDHRAPGANGAALCTFDNGSMTFSSNLWGPGELKAACAATPGVVRLITRTVNAFLDYNGITIPGSQVDVSPSASVQYSVQIMCQVTTTHGSTAIGGGPTEPAKLNPKNLPTLSSTTPVSAAIKNGASPALDAQTLGRWVPPHTAAKNDIDAAYAALVGAQTASFSKYVAASLVYENQYRVCVNANIQLAGGTAVGCLPADTWGQCTDKLMSKCMGTASTGLTAARDAVRHDATALAVAAQHLADTM